MDSKDNLHHWIAFQICDSGFPGGSFAHSFGLESSFNHGFVAGVKELKSFVVLCLEQTIGQSFPFLSQSHIAFSKECFDSASFFKQMLSPIDELCHISLTNDVSRRSSISQGKCFLRAAKEAFTSTSLGVKSLFRSLEAVSDGSNGILRCHYAPIFGCICALLGISVELTRRLFLRCPIRDIFSSAARLNIIGPLEGARCQRELAVVAEGMLSAQLERDSTTISKQAGIKDERCIDSHSSTKVTRRDLVNTSDCDDAIAVDNISSRKRTDIRDSDSVAKTETANCYEGNKRRRIASNDDEPKTTVPILEILQARHDTLYARLFNS